MSQVVYCQQCGRLSQVSSVRSCCGYCGSRRVSPAQHATPYSINLVHQTVTQPSPATGVFNKPFLLLTYLAIPMVLCLILGSWILAESHNHENPIGFFFMGLGFILGLATTVQSMRIIWRAWNCLKSSNPLVFQEAGVISPSLAVGLLFLPLFNLYWVFRVFYFWGNAAKKVMHEKMVMGPTVKIEPGQILAILCSVLSVSTLLIFAPVFQIVYIILLPVCLVVYLQTMHEMNRVSNLIEGTVAAPRLVVS